MFRETGTESKTRGLPNMNWLERGDRDRVFAKLLTVLKRTVYVPQYCPFTLFWGEGSPTKIDHREKGTLVLTSPLEDLAVLKSGLVQNSDVSSRSAGSNVALGGVSQDPSTEGDDLKGDMAHPYLGGSQPSGSLAF